jgi:hypothetical protein
LLISDITYSFIQYYHEHFDGDMASFILRDDPWKPVLSDPLGFKVLFKNESYPDPNRFFSHWFMSYYFQSMPFFLQKFINPLDSVYLSCALIKIITHILLLYLIASLVTNEIRISSNTILVMIIASPLFQAIGYSGDMGIIDQSISYFFFYGLPYAFCLLFYFFLRRAYIKRKMPIISLVILFILAVILPFSGPLVPGIILVVNVLIISKLFLDSSARNQNQKFSKNVVDLFFNNRIIIKWIVFISCLSLISLYVGSHNSINDVTTLSVIERYRRLPAGIYFIISQKLGLPLLLLCLIINTIFITRSKSNESHQLIYWLKQIGLFTLIYILLLPLGGFRWYRPNIIRFDTFMPVTFLLIIYFGLTSFYLLKQFTGMKKFYYIGFLILLAMIYTNADRPKFKDYYCERAAIESVSTSTEKIVKLPADCTVMSWGKIKTPLESELNAELLKFWNITKQKTLFYQE